MLEEGLVGDPEPARRDLGLTPRRMTPESVREVAGERSLAGDWSVLVVRTRSAVPALVCHLLWDLAVLFMAPYGR
jgi:hypothetical protein